MVNKLKKKSGSVIRSTDMFASPIVLNYNENGNTHQTYFGGFVTISFISFVIAWSSFKIYNMAKVTEPVVN